MSLLDEFTSISLEVLQEFVAAEREEDLHLDFKVVGDPGLSREDRKSLAVALSGFANSDGGILVWGIEARPNGSGVDCAVALREIAQASLCLTRLNTLTGQCVSPLVDGVQHRVILRDRTAGFCVSVVPPSDSGPHMAKAGQDRYFKRSGSGFYRMEHFDLEDMFGRRQRPSLSLNLDLVPRSGDDPHEELHFSIINSGRGVAKCAGFFCKFEAGVTVAGVRGHLTNVSSLNHGIPSVSYQDNVGVVHPNRIASSAGHAIIQRSAKGQPLNIEVSLYCENTQVRSSSLQVLPSAGGSA
jgi:Schlafen, AlbA_2